MVSKYVRPEHLPPQKIKSDNLISDGGKWNEPAYEVVWTLSNHFCHL